MNLKKLLPLMLLAISMLLFEACKDEEAWMNEASITGYDLRLCPCCGGFVINIDEQNYRFYELPTSSNFDINAQSNFPIDVRVNWHAVEDACLGDETSMILFNHNITQVNG